MYCPGKQAYNSNAFVSSFRLVGTPTAMTQCFDIYSLLRAVNRTHVNYFSLDVEGAEYLILKTIPFDRITVDIFSVEYMVWGNATESLVRLQQVRNFFKTTGLYEEVGIIPPGESNGVDVIFKRINNWSSFCMVLFNFKPNPTGFLLPRNNIYNQICGHTKQTLQHRHTISPKTLLFDDMVDWDAENIYSRDLSSFIHRITIPP